MRTFAILCLAAFFVPTTAQARKLDFKSCSAAEQKDIKAAVKWLVDHYGDISKNMGKNGLMSWPGGSKAKLEAKLADKDLKFKCIAEKNKCQPKQKGATTTQLRGRTVPVFHQKRVALCTNVLADQADMAAVIIHELAHLVRANVHRTDCKKRCTQPRFSESVEQAAFWAHTGTAYSGSACSNSCPK